MTCCLPSLSVSLADHLHSRPRHEVKKVGRKGGGERNWDPLLLQKIKGRQRIKGRKRYPKFHNGFCRGSSFLFLDRLRERDREGEREKERERKGIISSHLLICALNNFCFFLSPLKKGNERWVKNKNVNFSPFFLLPNMTKMPPSR